MWRTARLCTRILFCIIYINDLPACSSSYELEFILFADDSSTFFEHSDLNVLTSHHFRNRIQCVPIDNSKSDALRQICGVPQGSILGSSFVLFISMISQPALVLMNSNLYYLLMTAVHFLNIVTWMYLPPILTTSSTMFQLG